MVACGCCTTVTSHGDACLPASPQIAQLEGVTIENAALDTLIESCNGDMRQCLHSLQMWAITAKAISASSMQSRMGSVCPVVCCTSRCLAWQVVCTSPVALQISKDATLRLDAFTATPKMFSETKSSSLDARLELFYVDYDMIPLLVQQAYPSVVDRTAAPDIAKINRCTKAADAVSDADIYSDYVRSRQAWGMLPAIAAANVRACGWASGPPPFLQFPTYLAKFSSRNKRARLLAEMGLHMAAHSSGGREAIRLDYFEPVRDMLFAPLIGDKALADPAGAAQKSIEILDVYGLSKVRHEVRAGGMSYNVWWCVAVLIDVIACAG